VDRIIISDTIPPFRLDARLVAEKVTILSASQAIADGIRNIAAIQVSCQTSGSELSGLRTT
jgi:phosphoribosylpyrophosphate synthetase